MKFKKKEKEKRPKAEISKGEIKEETSQIKTDMSMKVGRVILWLVILFLLLRGIVSILAPSSEVRLEKIVDRYSTDAKLRETVQVGAAAFAEDFAYEYYTFSGEFNSDYGQRLKRYLARSLEIKSPESGKYQMNVELSKTFAIYYRSQTDFDVDVHLQVIYNPLAEGLEKEQKDIYIRVPISVDKKGNYAVTSLPEYIPQVKSASITPVDTYKGKQIDSDEIQRIKETLGSFFTAYYSGTANEISYYLTPDSNVRGTAAGMVKFSKIDYATVYKDEQSSDYLVDTELTVLDNNQEMKQRLFLRLQYTKGHYYVKSISTRPI